MTNPTGPQPGAEPLDLSQRSRDLLAEDLEKLAKALREDRAVVYENTSSWGHGEPNRLTVSAAWFPEVDVPNGIGGPRADPKTGFPVWGVE